MMHTSPVFYLALATVVLGAGAQTKPKPPTKPKPTAPQKQPAKPAGQASPTLGTVQLPGDNGKLGTTYQLGDKGDELHLTLDSVAVAPYFSAGDDLILAKKGERILLINYTVQNPQKSKDMRLDWNSFKFTAISPNDGNFTGSNYIYQTDTGTRYSSDLKPAQKVKVTAVLTIYPDGPLKKLMVQRGSGAVLRYDLDGKLTKTTSSFAPNGLDFVDEIKTPINQKFDVGGTEVEVQEIAVHPGALGRYSASTTNAFFTVQLKLTNLHKKKQKYDWNTFTPSLTDENGEALNYFKDFVSVTSQSSLATEVDPGESVRGWLVFTGPKAIVPTKLKLQHNWTSRTATLSLSDLVKK